MTSASLAEQITKKSKSNFSISFFFLNKERRFAITQFYAFNRIIDDAVDELPEGDAQKNILYWREQINAIYFGHPEHTIAKSLQNIVRDFNIPKDYLDGILNGVAIDLHKKSFRDFDELSEYCFGVASLVGLVCMKIFGLAGKLAEDAAMQLGMALQLTNILRDVAIDGRKGRVYLPQSLLKEHGLTTQEILLGYPIPKVKTCLQDLADHAENYYDQAFANMEMLPRKPLTAAWMMGKVYYQLLQKIKRSQYAVYQKKITLSKLQKIKIVLQEMLKSWRSRI